MELSSRRYGRATPRGVLDPTRRFATGSRPGKPSNAARGASPTSSAWPRRWRGGAIASTTSRERSRAVVLDVGRDLGHVARREPQPDRADRRADPRRRPRGCGAAIARASSSVAGGASSTLNATSGGRAATSTAPAVGWSLRGPKSGRSSPAVDPLARASPGRRGAARPACAPARARRTGTRAARAPRRADRRGRAPRRRPRRGRLGIEVHDRRDVDRAHPRVDALRASRGRPGGSRSGGAVEHRLRELARARRRA